MDLSVVIPAYQEAARLGPTLEGVLAYLESRGDEFEVVVVDDGSDDGTPEIAARYTARGVRPHALETNRGKGAALKAGVALTHGRRVLLTDADLSTPIDELPRLEACLVDAEMVIGSRAVAGSRITRRQPVYREAMGRIFNLLTRLAGVRGLSDTQCGFKLLDGETARRLFAELTVERFAYDVELVWLARRHGFRVREVGVQWENSPDSRVHPVLDSLRMLWDLVRLRLRRRRRT